MTSSKLPARVLIIAGSDSGGGAGIQGDIKTVTCLGGYAATAITALTAQNTTGVYGVHNVPDEFVAQQMRLVLDDIGADAIKTGMLNQEGVIHTIADTLADYPPLPFVLDPVMVAKGGAALLENSALAALKTRLIPMATVVTPNIPEAELLAGMPIKTVADMELAAHKILQFGCRFVLLKGGHLEESGSAMITDLLLGSDDRAAFSHSRIPTTATHGTGCTLASAIATGIAQKMPLVEAVARARSFVQQAIKTAPKLGSGHSPLWHAHTVTVFRSK